MLFLLRKLLKLYLYGGRNDPSCKAVDSGWGKMHDMIRWLVEDLIDDGVSVPGNTCLFMDNYFTSPSIFGCGTQRGKLLQKVAYIEQRFLPILPHCLPTLTTNSKKKYLNFEKLPWLEQLEAIEKEC